MAPEVFNSEFMRYGASTDMYSFGVLAAELLVEERPWGNMPQGAIAHAVVNGHKRPLVVKWQPSEGKERKLRDLVGNSDTGCFAKAWSQRPSAAAFVTLLSLKRQVAVPDVFASFEVFVKEPRHDDNRVKCDVGDKFELEMDELGFRLTPQISTGRRWGHMRRACARRKQRPLTD
jgi:serine/threonine protein kinase